MGLPPGFQGRETAPPSRTLYSGDMESTHDLRVRYAETDAMGIAHHGSYVVWLEAGRTELLRERGRPYSEWEAEGVFMSVGEVQITYRAPARFDELIRVHTRIVEAGRRKVVFTYRLEREGVRLAEARTVHLVTGIDGRARTLPDPLLALLRLWTGEHHGPGQERP